MTTLTAPLSSIDMLPLTVKTLMGDFISIEIPRRTLWTYREMLYALHEIDPAFPLHFTTVHHLDPDTFEPLHNRIPITEDSILVAVVATPTIYINHVLSGQRQIYHVKVYCPSEYSVDSYDIVVKDDNHFWVVESPHCSWAETIDEDTISYATTVEEAVERCVPFFYRESLLRAFHAKDFLGTFESFPYDIDYDHDHDW